jgi:hypothetical protein
MTVSNDPHYGLAGIGQLNNLRTSLFDPAAVDTNAPAV